MIYLTGSFTKYVVVVDINNDNQLDIVVGYSDNIGVLLGYGNGTFAQQIAFSPGTGSLAIGDFNNDTHLDIVALSGFNDSVSILLQYNRGALIKYISYASGGASSLRYVSISDLNNDTRLDIIVANYGTNDIGILVGSGNDTFLSQKMLISGSNSHPSAIAIADYNGDTLLDIAVLNYGTKDIDMLIGNAKGTFTTQTNNGFHFVASPFLIVSGDFSNDGKSEIAVACDGNDNVDVFTTYNTGSFVDPIIYATGTSPYSVAVGDFNNDNRLDIVVLNRGDNNVSVFSRAVAVGDFNNDNRLDIVVANGDDNNVSVLLAYGNGSFADQMTYSTGRGSQTLAVGDFNNDNRLDIVVTNSIGNNTSVLLGFNNGSFADQMMYSTGSDPLGVAVGDFNNDNLLDIVVANDYSVGVLLGYGN
ncbi:unnamed protein product, partial [Adineta steineri]